MNHFEKLLEEARAIHDKKSHDYASDEDRFSSFTRAAEIVSWFKNPIDQVFACMIGIKLARLAELKNGKEPNNESIRDSHLDLFVYSGLWTSYYDSLFNGLTKQKYLCSMCSLEFGDPESRNDHERRHT
jgi:hypothetical protein